MLCTVAVGNCKPTRFFNKMKVSYDFFTRHDDCGGILESKRL